MSSSSHHHTHNEQTVIEEALKYININAHHVNGHPHVHSHPNIHRPSHKRVSRRRFQNTGSRDHYPLQPHPDEHHKKTNNDEKKEEHQKKKEVDEEHKHKHSHPLIHKKSDGGCCRIKSSDAICPKGKVSNSGTDKLCCKHSGNSRRIDSYPFCH